jgi:hypothetical protein
MKRTVSIQDIAQAAGVSHTTVSRALRDSPLISQRGARPHPAASLEEMGYVPNAVAQSLRGERTHTIGLVVTTIADPFVGRVVRGVEAVARQHHLSLLSSAYPTTTPTAKLEGASRISTAAAWTALSLPPRQLTARSTPRRLQRVKIPHGAESTRRPRSPLEHAVTPSRVDDAAGARAAVEHLRVPGPPRRWLPGGRQPPALQPRPLARGLPRRAGECPHRLPPRADWAQVAPPAHHTHNDDVRDGQVAAARPARSRRDRRLLLQRHAGARRAAGLPRAGRPPCPTSSASSASTTWRLAQLVAPPLTTVHQPKLRLGPGGRGDAARPAGGPPGWSDQVLAHRAGPERASTSSPPAQPDPARTLLAGRPVGAAPRPVVPPVALTRCAFGRRFACWLKP